MSFSRLDEIQEESKNDSRSHDNLVRIAPYRQDEVVQAKLDHK